jgi:hypothetical protein
MSTKHAIAATVVTRNWNFFPRSIAGLKLDLDASKGTYTTEAMTTPATADATAVGGWADQSGNGNHFTQSTAGFRPLLKTNILNGKPVIRFARTDDTMISAAVNTIPKVAPVTIFMVTKVTEAAQARTYMGMDGAVNNKGWKLVRQGTFTGALQFVKAGVGNVNGVVSTVSSAKYEVITAVFDATFDLTTYINGAKRDYILSASDCNAGDIAYYLASNGVSGSAYMDGDFARILVYAAALTPTQVAQVSNYLARLYNITQSPSMNVSSYLTIPDYPGAGTVVHPDVLYFAAGWNGYKYWMAYTPYPPASVENPSIAVSNDGTTWITPPGLTNPLDANPGSGWNNSDASLCMSADGTTTMYIFWREYKSGSAEKIYMRSSTDGVTWAAETLILTGAVNNDSMSPSVHWDGAQFVMYICNTAKYPTLQYRTCATIDGVWSAASDVVFTNAHNLAPKHVDVILSGSTYYMIFMDVDSGVNGGLYLATSTDGINFTTDPNFRIPAQVGVWDYLPYRASLLPVGDGLDIYYSGMNNGETDGRIAKTHYRLP